MVDSIDLVPSPSSLPVAPSSSSATAGLAATPVVPSVDPTWSPPSATTFPGLPLPMASSSDSLLLSIGPLPDDDGSGGGGGVMAISEMSSSSFSSPSKPVFVRSNPVLSISAEGKAEAATAAGAGAPKIIRPRNMSGPSSLQPGLLPLPISIADDLSASSLKSMAPLTLSSHALDMVSATASAAASPSTQPVGFVNTDGTFGQPRLLTQQQESKFPWIKTNKMDMAANTGNLINPVLPSNNWTTLAAADVQNPLGTPGPVDVLEEPVDVTMGGGGGILGTDRMGTASTKMKQPILLAEDLEQAGVRFVSAQSAPVAPQPTVSPSQNSRISVEQVMGANLTSDIMCLSGDGGVISSSASPAAPVRIVSDSAGGSGVLSSGIVAPPAPQPQPISIVSHQPVVTSAATPGAIRLVPSASYPRPAPPSVPSARVRIIPEAKQQTVQLQPRPQDVKVVSVLNLTTTHQPVTSSAAPLPTVILKPIVQEQSTSSARRQSGQASSATSHRIQRRQRSDQSTSQQVTVSREPTAVLAQRSISSDPRVESISCYKCTVCGFLGMTVTSVEEHCLLEHEEELEGTEPRQQVRRSGNRSRSASSSWMSVAIQEGVKLQCPLCPNQFSAESSRSFKVHVTDDHDKEEAEAESLFQQCNARRRTATINALRIRRRKERDRKRKLCPDQLSLEAYVDEKGELRVRTSGGDDGAVQGQQEQQDLSANECIIAMHALKASEEVEKGKELLEKFKITSGENGEDAVSLPKRSRIGRPRGSRTVGITRLRRAASAAIRGAVVLSDHRMGAECGVGDCAVRMRSEENLDRHRRSHADLQSAVGFRCTECPEVGGEDGPAEFQFWSQLAMHLWRKHKIDMELFGCPECGDKEDGFRCFTQVIIILCSNLRYILHLTLQYDIFFRHGFKIIC